MDCQDRAHYAVYTKVICANVLDCGLLAESSLCIHTLCNPSEIGKCVGLWTFQRRVHTACIRCVNQVPSVKLMCMIVDSYHSDHLSIRKCRIHTACTHCVNQVFSIIWCVWDWWQRGNYQHSRCRPINQVESINKLNFAPRNMQEPR